MGIYAGIKTSQDEAKQRVIPVKGKKNLKEERPLLRKNVSEFEMPSTTYPSRLNIKDDLTGEAS